MGTHLPSPKRGQSSPSNFGTWHGGSPDDLVVLDGDPAPPQKGGRAPSPIFGPFWFDSIGRAVLQTVAQNGSPYAIRPLSVLSVCPVYDVGVLWPNGWMDQDATWYEGMALVQATLCYMGIQLPLKGHSPPFWTHMSVVAKRSSISATAHHLF